MLKKNWNTFLLFIVVCAFEAISFSVVSRILTDAIYPLSFLPIYIIPLALVRGYQLRSGTLPGIYIIVPFLQVFLLYAIGYSVLALVIAGLFILWRLIVHMREPYIDSQGIWLVAVLASGFPILIVRTEYLTDYVAWYLVLLVLYAVITVMIRLMGNSWRFMKKGYQAIAVYLLGAIGVTVIIFHSGLSLLKALIPLVGQGAAYIISYPLMWLFGLMDSSDKKDLALSKLRNRPELVKFENVEEFNRDYNLLAYTLIIIAVILVIGIMVHFLRKNIGSSVNGREGFLVPVDESSDNFSFWNSLPKISAFYSQTGRNEVRIQFQKLQLYLEKRGYGRLPSETAEEWFNRLQLLEQFKDNVLAIYYKSRYNESTYTATELDSYFNGIKEIRKLLSKKTGSKKEGREK